MGTPIDQRINIRAFRAPDAVWRVVVELRLEDGSASEMARFEGGESPREFRAWRAMSMAEHYRGGYLDGHQRRGSLGPVLEVSERIAVVPYQADESWHSSVYLSLPEVGNVELSRVYSFAGAAGTIAARRSTMLAEQYRRGWLDGYEPRTSSSYLTGLGARMHDLGEGHAALHVVTGDVAETQAAAEELLAHLQELEPEIDS